MSHSAIVFSCPKCETLIRLPASGGISWRVACACGAVSELVSDVDQSFHLFCGLKLDGKRPDSGSICVASLPSPPEEFGSWIVEAQCDTCRRNYAVRVFPVRTACGCDGACRNLERSGGFLGLFKKPTECCLQMVADENDANRYHEVFDLDCPLGHIDFDRYKTGRKRIKRTYHSVATAPKSQKWIGSK